MNVLRRPMDGFAHVNQVSHWIEMGSRAEVQMYKTKATYTPLQYTFFTFYTRSDSIVVDVRLYLHMFSC